MARSQIRFAGTPTSRTSYTPKSGQGRGFEPISLSGAGLSTNAGSAAGIVNTSDIFKGISENSPNYQDIGLTAASNAAAKRMAVENAEASAAATGIQSAAKVAAAEEQAKAMEAQASAAKKGGFMSAVTGIASAAAPLLLSDETTKHTIDLLEDACAVLRELKPVTFFYKEEYSASPERMHYGFIAQEYQKVMPDATYYDEAIGKLCIDTTEVISLLVRANQELQTRITRLEAKHALAAV